MDLIKYKLLGDGEGVFEKRFIKIVDKSSEIEVSFDGAPEGCTAVFESERIKYYRSVSREGICKIKTDCLTGSVKVSVFTHAPFKTWRCERLEVKCDGDKVALATADFCVDETVQKVRTRIDGLTKLYQELSDKCLTLEKKLSEILEAYDII